MKTYKAILLTILFVLLGLFWGYESWIALKQHWALLMRWFNSTKMSYYPWYLWLLLGGVIFPLMNKYLIKNIDMTKTFTHELTHLITGLLTFRRIHSFHVSEKSGGVWSSGNEKIRFFTSLAPYCFPIYTFPLLMVRCIIIPDFYPIIDALIGFSIGLHFVCAKEQTRTAQPDIQQFPLWFSCIYLGSVWLFDISLIMLSFLPKLNIFRAFANYAMDAWRLIF